MDITWKSVSARDPYAFIAESLGGVDELAPVFDATWRQFFANVVPQEAASPWELIRCDLWIDDGFIAISVEDRAKPFRRKSGAVKLLLPAIREQVDDQTEALDDDAFETWITDKLNLIASMLAASLENCMEQIPWNLVTAPGPLQVSFFAPEETEPFTEHMIERPQS